METVWLSTNGTDWYSMKTGQIAAGNGASSPNLPYEFTETNRLYLASPGKPLKEVALAGSKLPDYTAMLGSNAYFAVGQQGVFRTRMDYPVAIRNSGHRISRSEECVVTYSRECPFLAIEDTDISNLVAFSGNGTDWESINGPAFHGNIVYHKGYFYCGNEELFYRSSNGINWTTAGTTAFPTVSKSEHHELIASPVGFLSSAKNKRHLGITLLQRWHGVAHY